MDPTAPHIRVCADSGQPMTSAGTFYLVIPQLPSDWTTTGHVMAGFQDNLVSVGPIYDANCTVTFLKHAVNICSSTETLIITGWCETDGPRLWRMSLLPNP